MSATDRRLTWYSIVSNWLSNITIISNNLAVDGKKAHRCVMQQFCREENLNKISFIFYFLRSVYRFCLFVTISYYHKGRRKVLLVKIFNTKHKIKQILPANIEKIKFCLFKKIISCSFRS